MSEVVPVPRSEVQSGAYLLHFDEEVPYEKYKRYGGKRHYVGASTDIFKRVSQHRAGEGSIMTKMAFDLGIRMDLVGIFPGADSKYVESIITQIGATRFCPTCNVEAYWERRRRQRQHWENLPLEIKTDIWNKQRKK